MTHVPSQVRSTQFHSNSEWHTQNPSKQLEFLGHPEEEPTFVSQS